MRRETYTVRVHDEGADGMWAEVLELPGCFASGTTLHELREAVAEAIGLYLSDAEHRVLVEHSTWPLGPQQAEYRDEVVLIEA